MDASYEGLKHLAENLLSEGTTSFLATTMTQSDENIIKALANIAKYHQEQQQGTAAEIVGIHLEGPFISEHKVGAKIHNMCNDLPWIKFNNFNKVRKV